MDSVSYLNPPQLHSNPAFTQAVRIPAGHDLIVIGGQNGVDTAGRVVSSDLAGQARQALINLQACLREANADLDHVVRWSILIKDAAPLNEGLCRLPEIWGEPVQSARPHGRHDQRLRRYRCSVRNRSARGCAQQVKCALSLKREGCPSTSSRHRLIKIPCGGCDR